MIIVLILTSLVALNFFLLFFSCNKSTKKESVSAPDPIFLSNSKGVKTVAAKVVTKQLPAAQLAPTGS